MSYSIKWVQNLQTNVGNDRVEVGVHTGQENGVNLHFLHNFDYFPTPYNTVSGRTKIPNAYRKLIRYTCSSLGICDVSTCDHCAVCEGGARVLLSDATASCGVRRETERKRKTIKKM